MRCADMHSHFGVFRDTGSLREAMTRNGILLMARKVVADQPVIGRGGPGKGLQALREAAAGELAQYFDARLAKLRAQHRAERLPEVVTADGLDHAVKSGEPAVALAAEGADFLEGDLGRLEAARAQGLAHLQLVHYRVSEVGDISTERPVHEGLTAFGKEVVAACNRLRILVDVAHGTTAVIEQALALAARPVVYSHGHVIAAEPHWTQNPIRARAIHRPLAQKIAKQGGVIGIWPLGLMYRTLEAYADALIDAAGHIGPAHVGVGTDMNGITSSVMPGYETYPALEEILAKRRVATADIGNILGGNYLRVLRQSLAG